MTRILSPGRTGGGINTATMIGEAIALARGDLPRRFGTFEHYFERNGSHPRPRGAIWPIGVVSFHQSCPKGRHPGDSDAPQPAIRSGDEEAPAQLGRRRLSRLLQGGARLKYLTGHVPAAVSAALVFGSAWACSGERYSRPAGPVPRYEPAPVLAWDAGTPPEDVLGARSLQERQALAARASRLSARSTILEPGEPLDERHDLTNVSDD